MKYKIPLLIVLTVSCVYSSIKVLFLPFDDRVKLKEAWNLDVDVPRWYSQTVDTIIARDSSVQCVSFDSVVAFVNENKWKRDEWLSLAYLKVLGNRFNADYAVTGKVTKFEVVKQALNADTRVSTSNNFNQNTSGYGGATLMGGIQNYSAKVIMDVHVFDLKKGNAIDHFSLNSEQKDGGIKVWLPFQIENDEITFYYLSRTPFGSVYFNRSVVGALMKQFSVYIHDKLRSYNPQAIASAAAPVLPGEFLEGKILERTGSDIYINLGSGDNLFLGAVFETVKPDHPILGDKGDTLGWTDRVIGEIKVRSIKAAHFSSALLTAETDSVKAGCTVRLKSK